MGRGREEKVGSVFSDLHIFQERILVGGGGHLEDDTGRLVQGKQILGVDWQSSVCVWKKGMGALLVRT